MKNLLILFAILPSFVFAQTALTEATFNEMNVRFMKNPIEFLKNETAQGFVYVNSVGIINDLKSTMLIYEIADEPMREFSNVKIHQDGSNANIEAILKHTIVVKKTKESRTLSEGVLCTMVAKNGKWLLQTVHHLVLPVDKATDEAAIKQVIEGETQAYLDGDGKKLQSYWSGRKSDEHDSQFLVAIIGQPFAKGESMEKLAGIVVPNLKKQAFTVERSDFEVRINKNMAWATYTQKAMSNGKVIQTDRETRILERINDVWKLVYVGEQGVK